jgi:ribosomal protein S18 acetylase RimI-like enzyme
VTIARANSTNDWLFVRDLGRRAAGASVSPMRGDARVAGDALMLLIDRVAEHDHSVLIARVHEGPHNPGTRVGFAIVTYSLPDEISLQRQAFVAYMAVEPRFQRQGIGRALIAAVEDEAKARGIGHVSLMVTEANTQARALYYAMGFTAERRLLTKGL